jgi:hypothetical protein
MTRTQRHLPTTLPAFRALLSTTRFSSLRTLEMEIASDGSGQGLPVSYRVPATGPLPQEMLRRLHRVRIVFRNIDVIHDIELLLSVFRLKGRPDIVEIDMGQATLAESANVR